MVATPRCTEINAVVLVSVIVLLELPSTTTEPKSLAAGAATLGVLFCTARLALRMPAPQLLLRAQSRRGETYKLFAAKDGKAVNDEGADKIVLISAGLRAGFLASINAAAADT